MTPIIRKHSMSGIALLAACSLAPMLLSHALAASTCRAFWSDLKRRLRSEKAHIEFHEKVHLA